MGTAVSAEAMDEEEAAEGQASVNTGQLLLSNRPETTQGQEETTNATMQSAQSPAMTSREETGFPETQLPEEEAENQASTNRTTNTDQLESDDDSVVFLGVSTDRSPVVPTPTHVASSTEAVRPTAQPGAPSGPVAGSVAHPEVDSTLGTVAPPALAPIPDSAATLVAMTVPTAAQGADWTLWTRDGVSEITGSTPLMKVLTEEFPFFMSQHRQHHSTGWTQQYKCSANCPFVVLVECEYGASGGAEDSFRLFLNSSPCTCGKMANKPSFPDSQPTLSKKRSISLPSQSEPKRRSRPWEDECWKDENGKSVFVGEDALEVALQKCHGHLVGKNRQYRVKAPLDKGWTQRLLCSNHVASRGGCKFQVKLDCDYAEPGKMDWTTAKFRLSRSLYLCTCNKGDSYVGQSAKEILNNSGEVSLWDGVPMQNEKGEGAFHDYQTALSLARSYGELEETRNPGLVRKDAVHLGYYVSFTCKWCQEKKSAKVRIYCTYAESEGGSNSFTVSRRRNVCEHCQLVIPNGQDPPQAKKGSATIIPNDDLLAESENTAQPSSVGDANCTGGLDHNNPSRNLPLKPEERSESETKDSLQIDESDSGPVTEKKQPRFRRTGLFRRYPWVDSRGNRTFHGIESAIKALEECARTQPAYRSLFFDQRRKNGGLFMRPGPKRYRETANPGWSRQYLCFWSMRGCPFMIRMNCAYESADEKDLKRATFALYLGNAPCNGHLHCTDTERVKVTIDSMQVLDFSADEFKKHCAERTGLTDPQELDRAYSCLVLRKAQYQRILDSLPAQENPDDSVDISETPAAFCRKQVAELDGHGETIAEKRVSQQSTSQNDSWMSQNTIPKLSKHPQAAPLHAAATATDRIQDIGGIWQPTPWVNSLGVSLHKGKPFLQAAISELLSHLANESCFPVLRDRAPEISGHVEDAVVEIKCSCSPRVSCPFAIKIKKTKSAKSSNGIFYQLFLSRSECLSKIKACDFMKMQEDSHAVSANKLPSPRNPQSDQPRHAFHTSQVREEWDLSVHSVVENKQETGTISRNFPSYHVEDGTTTNALPNNERINLVLEIGEQKQIGNPMYLLLPPERMPPLLLDKPVDKDVEIQFDATSLYHSAGTFIAKSSRNSMSRYCTVAQEHLTNRRSLLRGCRQEQGILTGEGTASVPPFDGPVDRTTYTWELEQMNIGAKKCWDPKAIANNNERLSLELSDIPADLASRTAYMEAVYVAGGLQADAVVDTFLDLNQQEQNVVWASTLERDKVLRSLAETKDFARRAREIGCSVGNLLVEYYKWKGSDCDRQFYLSAKKRRLGESDECAACGRYGKLIVCDACAKAFHLGCVDPPLRSIPNDQWYCPACQMNPHRKSLSINWKSPTKKHSTVVLKGPVTSEPLAKRRLSMDVENGSSVFEDNVGMGSDLSEGTSKERPKFEVDTEANSAGRVSDRSGTNFFLKPRGMIWNVADQVWLAPTVPDDDDVSTGSFSDVRSLSSESDKAEDDAREVFSISSGDEAEVAARSTIVISLSSSSEEEDEEFQADELSDTESANDTAGLCVLGEGEQTRGELQAIRQSEPTSIAQIQPDDVYRVLLPFTPCGLLINIHGRLGGVGARFGSYRRLPGGNQGPAEMNKLFRKSGDVFLAVDGNECFNLPFTVVRDLLRRRADNQVYKDVVMGSFSSR